MNKLEEFFSIINNLSKNADIANEVNIEKLYNDTVETNNKLNSTNIQLNEELINLKNKLAHILEEKNNIIAEKDTELASYRKSSLLAGMNKQVTEQKNYITILEQQLRHYKMNNKINVSSDAIIELVENPILDSILLESILEPILEPKKKSKKEKTKSTDQYEKIEYKKEIYLKNIATNEIYKFTTENNNIDHSIGKLRSNGKIKFY